MKGGLWQKQPQKAMAAGTPTAMNFSVVVIPTRAGIQNHSALRTKLSEQSAFC